MKLSVVIITKNGERGLPSCLNSCHFADEILIVDSGSTDRTKEIAHSFGATIIHQDWLGFGPQKHFAVLQASYDWVLCLDDDEYLSDQLISSIKNLINKDKTDYCVYRINRCNKFLGRYLRHGEGYPDKLIRLFHRNYAHWTNDIVHEHVATDAPIGELSGDLIHDSNECLSKYLAKQNIYTTLQAEKALPLSTKSVLAHILISPFVRFIKYYFLKLGFLDGIPGFIHISIGCINSFTKYVKIYERQKQK